MSPHLPELVTSIEVKAYTQQLIISRLCMYNVYAIEQSKQNSIINTFVINYN